MNLRGSTIIITGGSRGIGREICALLAKEGANVVAVSRTRARVCEEMKKAPGKLMYVKADVTKEKQMENAFKQAKKRFKRIDGLVNNAGILIHKNIDEMSYEDYDKTMKINVRGTFTGCKLAKEYIKKGVVVNASSMAGLPGHGAPGLSVYNASKFAIIGLTEALGKELKPRLRMYAVTPHSVATGMSNFRGNSPVLVAKVYLKVLKEQAGIKPRQHVIAGTLKNANKVWKGGVPTEPPC